ncbi:hypothetical protein HY969_02215 [Candidatus Kaiserbacteria bacterium]|nr:hypothetical protein [Candidatus Kaiserbacteria bacterium]
MSGERPTNLGKKLLDKASKWMQRTTDTLLKDMPRVRDLLIDIEHNTVRVFIPRTGIKIQFRLMADPALAFDEAQATMDGFLQEPHCTPRIMRKHKILLISYPPQKDSDFQLSPI